MPLTTDEIVRIGILLGLPALFYGAIKMHLIDHRLKQVERKLWPKVSNNNDSQ